jgi:transcriptional regulator with GAF, ATPase, and Fis domain
MEVGGHVFSRTRGWCVPLCLPPTDCRPRKLHTVHTFLRGGWAKYEQDLWSRPEKARGNMFQAARDLRESYRVVNYKVKKYGIDPKRFTMGRRG